MNKDVHVEDATEEQSYTDLIAIEMAEVFDENSRSHMGNFYLSQEGMDELADIFEDVPLPLRGIVYGKFIDELNTRGVQYDQEMFRKPH